MPRPLHGPKPSTSRVKLSVHRPATVTNGWCVVLLLSFRSSVFRWRAKCTQLVPFRAKGCASPHTPRADQRVLELGLSAVKRARAPNDTFWDDRSRDISNATLFGTDSPMFVEQSSFESRWSSGCAQTPRLNDTCRFIQQSRLEQVTTSSCLRAQLCFNFSCLPPCCQHTFSAYTRTQVCPVAIGHEAGPGSIRSRRAQASCIARRFRVELSFDSRSPIKTVEICNLLC